MKLLLNRFNENSKIFNKISKKELIKFSKLCTFVKNCILQNNKIIIFGNGGSAADALHFSGELIGKFKKKRNAYGCLCLNTNLSSITSIGNDMDFKYIFTRQLEANYSIGDYVIVLSTSGNSKNIIEAIKFLNKNNHKYCLMTGKTGGLSKNISRFSIKVPSDKVDQIQEIHYMMLHTICDYIESDT